MTSSPHETEDAPSQAAAVRWPWYLNGMLVLLVLVATFLVYRPSLQNTFAMDDRLVAKAVLDSGFPQPMVHDESLPIAEYFRSHYWRGSSESDSLFRPVTILSYALTYRWFGKPARERLTEAREQNPERYELAEAWPHHVANIGLHMLATVLVWLLLRRLATGDLAAILGMLVFGLHAIHSEVVAAIVGRAELFGFVFGAGALLSWHRAWRSELVLAAPRYLLSMLLLFLAFCSKESALLWVPFLFVFALAARWREDSGAIAWQQSARYLAGTALVSAAPLALFFFLRLRMLADLPPVPDVAYIVNPIWGESLGTRFFSASWVLTYGLWLTVAPFKLAATYGHSVFPIIEGPFDLRFLTALVVLLFVLVGGLLVRRRQPLLFLAMAAFLGFSFLTSNIPIPIGTILGERLYYAPSLALSFLVAWLASRPPVALRGIVVVAACVWSLAASWVILDRNPVWKNDETLFLHEAAHQPRAVRMHLCAASVYDKIKNRQGTPPEEKRRLVALSLDHLHRAAEIDPDYALAWNNLAATYFEIANKPEAIPAQLRESSKGDLLRRALECAQTGLGAEHISKESDLFKLHMNLGLIRKELGQPVLAMQRFRLTLIQNPGFARAWNELSQHVGRTLGLDELAESVEAAANKDLQRRAQWQVYRALVAKLRGLAAVRSDLAAARTWFEKSEGMLQAEVPHLRLTAADTADVGRLCRAAVAEVRGLLLATQRAGALAGTPADVTAWERLRDGYRNKEVSYEHLVEFVAGAAACNRAGSSGNADSASKDAYWELYRGLVLHLRGLASKRRQDYAAARPHLQKAVKELPTADPFGGAAAAEARIALADVLFQTGDKKRALETLRALLKAPGVPEARRRLAEQLLRKVQGG